MTEVQECYDKLSRAYGWLCTHGQNEIALEIRPALLKLAKKIQPKEVDHG